MGGAGGTIGSGGSNGGGATAGSPGSGGTGGQGATCASIRMCDPTDQQIDGPCPAGRECYSFPQECFDATTLCMLPAGVHCSDLSCNPGDSPTTVDDQGCSQHPTACYTKQLCAHEIWCRHGADAGVDAGASDTGIDAGPVGYCGNGILDPGEQCDDGNTNNGDGCSATCQIETGWQCPAPGQVCMPCGTNACDAGPAGHCGDGIVQTGEECDCGDGTIPVPRGCPGVNNDNTYGGCTTKCTRGPRCGDGIVQTNYGEQCDLGSQNGVFQSGLGGECTPYCQWIPGTP